jgi:hypothetical protein
MIWYNEVSDPDGDRRIISLLHGHGGIRTAHAVGGLGRIVYQPSSKVKQTEGSGLFPVDEIT